MAYLISPEWERVSTITGIQIGESLSIQNTGRAGDLLELIISDLMPTDERGHVIRSLDPMFKVEGQDSEVWIRYIRYDLNCTITPKPQARCLANISDNTQIAESGTLPITSHENQPSTILLNAVYSLIDSNQDILQEMKLLNARYEEATETRITKEDITHAD